MKHTKFFISSIIVIIIFLSSNNCRKETIREIVRDTIEIKTRDTIEIIIRDTIEIKIVDSVIITDKKITFDLFDNPFGNGSSSSSIIFSTSQTSFSILDYQDIDSISFVINDLSIFDFNNNIITSKTLSVELMDLSNNVPIANSKIITSGISQSAYIASANLYKSFPVNPFHIGIRALFDNSNNTYWSLKHASLVLVRK